jgi:hypothetical protein
MMTVYRLALTVLITSFLTAANAQNKGTVIKGKVQQWPTDTVYLHTLPFHSPFSGLLEYQLVSKEGLFNFQFDKTDKPFVFFISSQKKIVDDQIKGLLFDNLTKEHYWGNCIKIYTYGKTTHLIEPGDTIDMNIKWNGWNRTDVSFKGKNKFKYEYYQKSFDLDDKLDKALSVISSENTDLAISALKNATKNLLDDLELNKAKLTPVFVDYIKAEIEFGAKKEFLKYLWSKKEITLKEIITTGNIPDKFLEIVAFNKSSINDATLISEEYNEFVEEYINFLANIANKQYKKYNTLSRSKLKVVTENLPENSAYYYVANQFLLNDAASEFNGLIKKFILRHPDGELNSKLKEKYKID